MGALLYLLSAIGTLVLVRRFVPISRPVRAVLILLPLCLTGRALFTGRVYAPIDLNYHFDPLASMATRVGIDRIANPLPADVAVQFLPWNAALRWSIAHRQLPLWNPFELSGNVLAAAAQAAPFHPVTLLGLLLPPADAPGFTASMTYFLAALGMFLFLRNLELRSLPSLFGAAGWALSTYVVAFTHTAHGNAIALLPLVMLGARMVALHPGVRATALLAASLILLTLCGHPETTLHVVALAAVYVIVSARARLGIVAASALGAGVIALLLTAFFLLPLIDAIPQTREYLHRQSGNHAGSSSLRVVAHLLRNDIVPFAEGMAGEEEPRHEEEPLHRSMGIAYAGAMLFAPALLALLRARTRETWFFAGVVLFGLLAGAEAPGLSDLLARLPLFSLAINARMISFAAFGICVLAAIGLQVSAVERERLAWIYLGVAGAITVLLAMIARHSTLTPDFFRVNAAHEIIPLLLAFALLRAPVRRSAVAGILGILLLQRVTEIGGFIPAIDRRAFAPQIAGFENFPPARRAVSHRRTGLALRAEHRRALRARRRPRLPGHDVLAPGGDVFALVDPAAGLVEPRRRSHRADAVANERPLRPRDRRLRRAAGLAADRALSRLSVAGERQCPSARLRAARGSPRSERRDGRHACLPRFRRRGLDRNG